MIVLLAWAFAGFVVAAIVGLPIAAFAANARQIARDVENDPQVQR